ncbi:depupylase/deamidase Dop [Bifidobacterium canis]|uniref:Ligase n=1 Tax=Bifidobacterium canis TaxID=2610880 RepID=A0A7K1J4Z0_9BIFI|nr:depupylase/deamidase Dop [Bifidobacterium canis]MUH59714.1 ligase [Bifidobacterium canis]
MSVRRVMGTETEYAVSVRNRSNANPVQSSFDVIAHAGLAQTRHIRWDYRQESPIQDLRGITLERAAARPDMLTDEPQRNITNAFAPNGGRMYVDHAHPEYSAPETTDPFEAVRFDFAGDLLMRQAAHEASEACDDTFELFRNNVDGKGAAWGSHENYQVRRDVPFDLLASLMTLHFVSRQIYTGAGRLGIGEHSETAGFQLSQRADYVHMKIGLQTTFDRPIINTRDEAHAPQAMRRLHVIVGDANRLQFPDALKLGTTSLLLWCAEQEGESRQVLEQMLAQYTLADPVEAMHTVSHDLSLSQPLALLNGGQTTAWQLQIMLRELVYHIACEQYDTDVRGEPLWPDAQTRSIMAMWQQALLDVAAVRHANDDERLSMAGEASRLEWLLKWQLLEKMRRRLHAESGGWDDARLGALELRWASLAPDNERVFAKARANAEKVVSDDDIADAARTAPNDTRAWLRAAMLRRFPEQIRAVSWTHITTIAYADGLCWTLDMSSPTAFNQQQCEEKVSEAQTAAELIAALGGTSEQAH